MNNTARAFPALAVLFSLIAIGNCLGQDKAADAAKVRERINTIIQQTGEGVTHRLRAKVMDLYASGALKIESLTLMPKVIVSTRTSCASRPSS